MAVLNQMNALLAPIRQRIYDLVARAVVTQVDDTKKLQLLQLAVLDGETRDRCERFQEYGYTANPPVNSEAVVIFVGGSREHPLVVGVDSRAARKTGLQPGEVAIYTDQGDYVYLKRGGTIEAKASTKLLVTSPLIDATGDANVAGVYKVAGTQVVGPRGSSVTGPTGGTTVDSQARTAINAIIARLQAHGLIS